MNPAHLFHASEEHEIAIFHPRATPGPSVGPTFPCVWAIGYSHLANYLSPRGCPRVIVRRGAETSAADAARFLGASDCVITIEHAWAARMEATPISLYAFAPGPHWRLWDANYQGFVSAETVAPVARHLIASPGAAMRERGVDLQYTDNLWPLIDAVLASTLAFSIIRKRNALPRPLR
jgi:hypothetical protein